MRGTPEEDIVAALALSRRPGVGAATFKKLMSLYGSPREALAALPEGEVAATKSETREGLLAAGRYLERGGKVFYCSGPGYPTSLLSLGEPPPVLFVEGDAGLLSRPLVAVVGAREVDEAGKEAARRIAEVCVRAGFGVVSGGARGVDGAAHEGALAREGETAAVLGTGIDVVYPPEHQELFSELAARGALLTELLPGTKPARGFFLTRNRIIAGLARAVIVVRGRARSGALTTARWSMRLSRPVAALAAEAGDPLGESAAILQARGAQGFRSPTELRTWLARLAL